MATGRAARRPGMRPRRGWWIAAGLLVAGLVVAPVTTRFAFAKARLEQGAWEPAYKLSSGHHWWRCLRFASSRGELHPCAERLGKHLSWHLGDRVSLMNIRVVVGGVTAYHHLSLRTAWTDWARLVIRVAKIRLQPRLRRTV